MSTDKSISVFIVEDQPIVRAGLVFMLQELEHVRIVGEASDGQSAVKKVLELRPDVTMMDISLPELDGISATKEIKKAWPESKVLILTTHENDHYIFASLTAGADGYCLKSATGEQLALALDVLRTGTVWLDPGIAQRVLQAQAAPATVKAESREPARKQFDLAKVEIEVLRMLVEGVGNEEMASRLGTDEDHVKATIRKVVSKLAVADRTQAAITALREGIVSIDCVTWRILRDARMVDPDL